MPIDDKRLALYAYMLYGSGGSTTPSIVPYEAALDQLRFTTIAPGGFGDLSCRVRVPNARLTPPELGLMANIALVGGGFTAFLGRWDEPGIALDATDGDQFALHAQGAATVLKDDPDSAAYSSQTAYSILTAELARRSAYLPIDSDYSLILPDAPTATFSPAFDGKDLEEELNELSPLLGDYQWGVWDHASRTDAAGFPTWQLAWHKRDTSTVSYTIWVEDEASYTVRPAIEYTYNVVQVLYRDLTTGAPSSVTVQDSRLNANGSQGTAPYPRRKLRKDLSAYHLSATQATALANALLAQYQNGGFKVSADVLRVEDANGAEIPLWMVRADANAFFPQLAPIGQQLPISPTADTNVYYLMETEYADGDSGSAPKLTLTCNSYYDTAAFQVARLQYAAEHKTKSVKAQHVVRAPGSSEIGQCGVSFPSNAVAGDVYEDGVNFKTEMSSAPTSITLTILSQSNLNVSSTAAITNVGFQARGSVFANGAGYARWQYTTHGN